MYAIKGTNRNMQCRGYQYELGKTYKMDEEPILCEQGFHACLNPYDVTLYYLNDGKNRYFLVDLGGVITNCDGSDTKVATNEITFLKEVFVDDFPALFEEFIQDEERLTKLHYVEGFVKVKKNDKWNHIGHDGNILYDEWFDIAWNFSGGFAAVKKGNKWNFIDKEGNYLSKEWFDETWNFTEGFAKVKKNGKYNFIDKDGNYLCKEWFDYVWRSIEGFVKVRKGSKYNFIGKEGKLLSKKWFDVADSFSNGVAQVMKNNEWYLLYPDGHLVLEV